MGAADSTAPGRHVPGMVQTSQAVGWPHQEQICWVAGEGCCAEPELHTGAPGGRGEAGGQHRVEERQWHRGGTQRPCWMLGVPLGMGQRCWDTRSSPGWWGWGQGGNSGLGA